MILNKKRQALNNQFIREALEAARSLETPDRFVRIAEVVSLRVAAEGKWESPAADRKEWRRKKPDGTYEYRDTPPEGGEGVKVEEGGGVKTDTTKKDTTTKIEPKEQEVVRFKHRVVLDKPKLEETLSKGYFTILSAGRNPNDPKEKAMEPDDKYFHERHEDLIDMLEGIGLPYTEVVGHYSGQEPSFLVFHDDTQLTEKTQKSAMIHHRDKKDLDSKREALSELGRRLNQDSVLHGSGGRNEILFTTGEKKGITCGGEGWNEAPDAEDYYTDIKLEDTEHTKFQLDIRECFEKGYM